MGGHFFDFHRPVLSQDRLAHNRCAQCGQALPGLDHTSYGQVRGAVAAPPRCAGPHPACFKQIHKTQGRRKRLPQQHPTATDWKGGHCALLQPAYTATFNPVNL